MNRRILAAAMATSLSLFAAQSFAAAPALFHHTNTTKATSAAKTITFHLRNDSAAALTIKAGEKQITVDPGKTADLKLQEGTQVMAVNGTPNIAPGTLITTVGSELQGNTLAVR